MPRLVVDEPDARCLEPLVRCPGRLGHEDRRGPHRLYLVARGLVLALQIQPGVVGKLEKARRAAHVVLLLQTQNPGVELGRPLAVIHVYRRECQPFHSMFCHPVPLSFLTARSGGVRTRATVNAPSFMRATRQHSPDRPCRVARNHGYRLPQIPTLANNHNLANILRLAGRMDEVDPARQRTGPSRDIRA